MTQTSKFTSIITSPKSLVEAAVAPAVGASLIVLIPLIAMQFTSEVVWTLSDFIIGWAILFSIGFAYQAIARKSQQVTFKIATGIATFTTLFIIWANLAVGIIGNEENPLNLLYFGVVLLAIFGSYIASLKAKAMFRVMMSVAALHAFVSVIGLSIFTEQNPEYTIMNVIVINCVLTLLWIVSGLLYNKSAEVLDERN
ncbi:MAG: hypothetical protein JJ966_02655 [Balneolaceae bacterium]|nr:hypothetical protein [Balneolaceae bacterium]